MSLVTAGELDQVTFKGLFHSKQFCDILPMFSAQELILALLQNLISTLGASLFLYMRAFCTMECSPCTELQLFSKCTPCVKHSKLTAPCPTDRECSRSPKHNPAGEATSLRACKTNRQQMERFPWISHVLVGGARLLLPAGLSHSTSHAAKVTSLGSAGPLGRAERQQARKHRH